MNRFVSSIKEQLLYVMLCKSLSALMRMLVVMNMQAQGDTVFCFLSSV